MAHCMLNIQRGLYVRKVSEYPAMQALIIIIIIIIIAQYLYSAMKSEDTEALGGDRLREVK